MGDEQVRQVLNFPGNAKVSVLIQAGCWGEVVRGLPNELQSKILAVLISNLLEKDEVILTPIPWAFS